MAKYFTLGGQANIITALTYYQTFMRYSANATYYCFLTAYVAVDPETYTTRFTSSVVGFNVLYNLGYMYTDCKNIYIYYNSKPLNY